MALLAAAEQTHTLGSAPAYTLHGSIFESDPIVPRTPGNASPVLGQHIPTLEIEIWGKKILRGLTTTLGPGQHLPPQKRPHSQPDQWGTQRGSYPLKRKILLLTSIPPGNASPVSGQLIPTLEIGI